MLLAQGILSFGEGFPFGVIWCPTLKRKSNSTSNECLINLRFFVTFPLGSDFSIWKAKKEIGGMFRRDAEPVIQDCAHRLFSFFGKYFKPVQFRGRLICIQNEATKPGAHPGSDHTISGNIYFDIANKPDRRVWLVCCSTEWGREGKAKRSCVSSSSPMVSHAGGGTAGVQLVGDLVGAVIESIVIHALVDVHAPQDDTGVIAVLQDYLL